VRERWARVVPSESPPTSANPTIKAHIFGEYLANICGDLGDSRYAQTWIIGWWYVAESLIDHELIIKHVISRVDRDNGSGRLPHHGLLQPGLAIGHRL